MTTAGLTRAWGERSIGVAQARRCHTRVFPPKVSPALHFGVQRFPCHPDMPVAFEEVDAFQPTQVWEMQCPYVSCRRRWRWWKAHDRVTPAEFDGPFTEPVPIQQSRPVDTWNVLARLEGERQAREATEERKRDRRGA